MPEYIGFFLTGIHRGCAIAYRFALEFPSYVTHLFTCAVPYLPTSEKYIPLEVITKFLPSLGYQLQFGSAEGIIESHTKDKAGIRNYLNAVFGGRTSDGKGAVTPEAGADLKLMPKLDRSAFISEEELDFYVEEYSRNGLRGPCKLSSHSLGSLQIYVSGLQADISKATTTVTVRPTGRLTSLCWQSRTASRSSARRCGSGPLATPL